MQQLKSFTERSNFENPHKVMIKLLLKSASNSKLTDVARSTVTHAKHTQDNPENEMSQSQQHTHHHTH